MLLVQRKRCSSSTSCAGLQSRELPPHARDSRSDCGLVAHESAREADQDWCKGGQPRALRHVSDGGGRNPTAVIRCDHAENCCTAITADSCGNMSNPVAIHAGQTSGEVYPYEDAARLFVPSRPKRASLRAEPTARLEEATENCRNHPASTRIGRSYGESPLRCLFAEFIG